METSHLELCIPRSVYLCNVWLWLLEIILILFLLFFTAVMFGFTLGLSDIYL